MPKTKATLVPSPDLSSVYYVENADGSDFTFYLPTEGNDRLLSSPSSDRADGDPKRFSSSMPIRVVRVSPWLKKGDLRCEFPELLTQLDEAAKAKPPKSNTKLAVLIWKEITDDVRKRRDLSQILRVVNSVLRSDPRGLLRHATASWLPEEKELRERLPESVRRSFENRKRFDLLFPGAFNAFGLRDVTISGRALICRSYRGKFLSVSVREKNDKFGFAPNRNAGSWPLSIADYCSELYDEIKVGGMHGLLVIAGATNSSKSEIATGLIFDYLKSLKGRSERRPHLVTFEDPIEKFYVSSGKSFEQFCAAAAQRKFRDFSVQMPAFRSGIDYTPREKDSDYADNQNGEALRGALEDALRQTPSVLFVGETRKREDWHHLIDFAGTGHLIVTTTHAESLTEAMRKLLAALNVSTPSQRSEIANRLLAIVHLRPNSDTKMLLPAVWRRTPLGKSSLTAEGLSSLLPHRPKGQSRFARTNAGAKPLEDTALGCLGRSWFAAELLKRVPKGKLNDRKISDQNRLAMNWDLEGV